MFKEIILNLFSKFGYEVKRIRSTRSKNSLLEMDNGIKRLYLLNITPNVIVDIGAAKGSWTKKAMDYWPGSVYKLIEPLREQIDMMPEIISSNAKVEIIEGAAGEKTGSVSFSITEDLDGSGVYGEGENNRVVTVYNLDEICRDSKGSYLLKLDTHGYEIPIFEGAGETLKMTDAIILEVYGFYVSPTGKLFHQISEYLSRKGFRLFDIVDIMRRPKDDAFWQADAIFLRAEHPVFEDNSYH